MLQISYNVSRHHRPVCLKQHAISPEVEGLIGSKIGLWEILLILVVALIIFGPSKLPELGRSIGNGLKEFRKATKELKDTISLDDDESDLKG